MAQNQELSKFGQALVVNTTSNVITLSRTLEVATISASGANGSAGQVLTSNGSSSNIYWSSPAPATNVNAQYVWTNTHTFQNTITFNTSILANTINATSHTTGGGYGTSTGGLVANATTIGMGNTTTNTFITNGLVQTTNGIYSVGQFNGTYADGIVVDYINTNGRISVGTADTLSFYTGGVAATLMMSINTTSFNLPTGAGLYVNGSVGTANQVLTSNGTGAYWASGGASGATLNANNTDTTTYYIGLANTSSGAWTNAVVSTTKLYFVPSTGTLSATVFNSLSDIAYKTNINTINNALDTVNSMRGVTFNWKEDDRPSVGVIAQELEKVIPELVTIHNDKKSVNYDGLIGVLIEAIKELKQEIDDLKSQK